MECLVWSVVFPFQETPLMSTRLGDVAKCSKVSVHLLGDALNTGNNGVDEFLFWL